MRFRVLRFMTSFVADEGLRRIRFAYVVMGIVCRLSEEGRLFLRR